MSRARAWACACGAAALAAGCGTGILDDPGGGDSNLPTSAAGPYEKLPFDFDTPLDEPYVLDDRAASFRDPAALPRPGGGFRLWFTQAEPAAPDASAIGRAELPGSLTELPDVGPALALAADADWEAGRVAAPSVVELDGGALVMFYEGGPPDAPAIGRADSDDGGATWTKHPANPVLAGAADPGAAALAGELLLYVTRPDAPGIFAATSADGVAFELAGEPVIAPRPDDPLAFDRDGVADPCPLVQVTPAGRTRFGLFFTGVARGNDEDRAAIGYAGSFDGAVWQRFMGSEYPVLDGGTPSERAPAVVAEPTRGVMFFDELTAGRGRIAAATHP